MLQAGGHVAEVALGTGEQQVAAGQYRPAVVRRGPRVHVPQQRHAAGRLSAAFLHVRLQQPGAFPGHHVAVRLCQPLQPDRGGERLGGVLAAVVLQPVQLRRQVSGGRCGQGADHAQFYRRRAGRHES